MLRPFVYSVLAALALLVVHGQSVAARQSVSDCPFDGVVPVDDLGVPTASGVNRLSRLSDASQWRAFVFRVIDPSGVFVYVGDQWYDVDVTLLRVSPSGNVSCDPNLILARSERTALRVLQYVRPDMIVLERLEPGQYVVLVRAGRSSLDPGSRFRSDTPFTVRVATTGPVCGMTPTSVRSSGPGSDYQIALGAQPLAPSGTAFMTFHATASPPYNDLFDFQWYVNGQSVPGATGAEFQVQASRVAAPGQSGQVSVTARGARPYPDPDQAHVPLDGGSLLVACSVTVG